MTALKSVLNSSLVVLLLGLGPSVLRAQTTPPFSISRIVPFDRAVPGQIMELQVVGLGGAPPVTTLPADDFTIELTQDGVTQRVRARMVTPGMSRTRNSDGSMSEPKPFQNVAFAVPHGLHPGDVQVVLFYSGKQANMMNLTIVD